MAGEESSGRSDHMETCYPAVVAIFATTVVWIGSTIVVLILTMVVALWRKPVVERTLQHFCSDRNDHIETGILEAVLREGRHRT